MARKEHMTREDAATLHLHLWLTALTRTLRAAVEQRSQSIAALKGARGPAGTLVPKHADRLLRDVETCLRHGPAPLPEIALTTRERRFEDTLREDAPAALPLDQLTETAALTKFDRSALLIAVAGEVLPEFPLLAGYVVDDLARGQASVDLILTLTRGKAAQEGWRMRRLGPGGPLRRLGLLRAVDGQGTRRATALAPVPGLVEWLLGARIAPPVSLLDPQMIWPADAADTPHSAAIEPATACLSRFANGAAGIWGGEVRRHDDIATAVARASQRPVYRLDLGGTERSAWQSRLSDEAAIASGAGAILWVETSQFQSADLDRAAAALAALSQRLLITGRLPWRDPDLIRTRPFADVTLKPEDTSTPDGTVLQRLHLGHRQRQAARQLARTEQRRLANGTMPEFAPILETAARRVAAPAHMASLRVIDPVRGIDDLVLPDDLHRQIDEIGTLYAEAPWVDASWGFGRLTGSDGALKALFTGDPGTGKTLAAEAIAHKAGVGLLKVDLSQIVSKWVGETEKNLETVFAHAEQSRAALFFDEAEALFGKRGEVHRGTDRYANMEVSFLLQRLESFSGGLVILASNLRGDIDPAFSRRFQVSLNFPRPGPDERLRLWRMAFASAPLDPEVDLHALARHDLTGGAIVTAARMAALLAAGEGAASVGLTHLERATERQFRKEARLMQAGRPDGLAIARARI